MLALEPFIGFRKKNNPSIVVTEHFCTSKSVILTQCFLQFYEKHLRQTLQNPLFFSFAKNFNFLQTRYFFDGNKGFAIFRNVLTIGRYFDFEVFKRL